jgi:hypothetical protein
MKKNKNMEAKMYVRRLSGTIKEKVEFENAIAKTARLEADVDYIAMMTDIDLTDEDGGEEDEQDEQ